MPTIMPAALHLLIPFALPPAEAPAALALGALPAFERIVARAAVVEQRSDDAFQRTLPHERWLAQQFDLAAPGTDRAPLAPYMLLADGGTPGAAAWACVEPVHVRIATDHLVLLDPASLAVSDAEAQALLDIARPLIEELGVTLQAPHPARWYLSSPQLDGLEGAAPLRASGRNIEIWLPHEASTGERSRVWMKLQNEVQMAWFEHALNEAREMRGLPPVNSIWFHAPGVLEPVHAAFASVYANTVGARGLGIAAQIPAAPAPASFAALPPGTPQNGTTLVELDTLTEPYMEQDWRAWGAALTALDHDWFAPALDALERGRLDTLALTLCGDVGWATLTLKRGDLRKFWLRRAFVSLFE